MTYDDRRDLVEFIKEKLEVIGEQLLWIVAVGSNRFAAQPTSQFVRVEKLEVCAPDAFNSVNREHVLMRVRIEDVTRNSDIACIIFKSPNPNEVVAYLCVKDESGHSEYSLRPN